MKGGARRKTTGSDRPPQPRTDPDPTEYYVEQQQQVALSNDGGGDKYEDEEDEEYDEEYEDQSDNEPEADVNNNININNSNNNDNDGDERPKLAEGFYEIESVRKKRSRKGKIQYLIKWRGWPEAANTWEPVENLMSCSDIIDAFEERMRSGKQRSSRKRKRKNAVAIQPPVKKKKQQQPHPQQQQQQGSPAATYDVPSVKLRIIEESLPNVTGNDPTCSKWSESDTKSIRNVRKPKHLSDNGSLLVSRHSEKLSETDELNLKLSELKGMSSTDKENINGAAVHIREDRSGEGVSPSNGISDVNGQNPVWVNRSGGAKRRKSGTVKRFKKDLDPTVSKDVHDATERLAGGNGVAAEHRVQNYEPIGNGYGVMNVVDTSKSMYAITKVIKPIEYSISTINDMQDILVTFLVLRSDGKEVMVDNRYLKAHYPLLLINFYEQNIQYTSPSE
ncbi:chromo domain protein LHP1-like [Bidens hawaiensis]|uniref:chromo domain protein LHP1-like n=1 Tax=Bidens hawaiensis TaxID=980011 RepID=UPI00404BA33C